MKLNFTNVDDIFGGNFLQLERFRIFNTAGGHTSPNILSRLQALLDNVHKKHIFYTEELFYSIYF